MIAAGAFKSIGGPAADTFVFVLWFLCCRKTNVVKCPWVIVRVLLTIV